MPENVSEPMDERTGPTSQESLRKFLTDYGWYKYIGRLSPDKHYTTMRDIGVTVYSNFKCAQRMPIETVYGYPIPYIPDKGMVYLECVGMIYSEGDEIRMDTDFGRWYCERMVVT